MAVQKIGISVSEFERFIALPENADRSFELIGGEIVEVVSNGKSSAIGSRLTILIGGFVLLNELGFTTGADGGYQIGSERYIPDFAFMPYTRQAEPSSEAYNHIPPALAVEVLSPSNSPEEIAVKLDNYLHAGVVVWIVNPATQRVTIHTPGALPTTYTVNDTIDGGSILPGLSIAVRDIFRK